MFLDYHEICVRYFEIWCIAIRTHHVANGIYFQIENLNITSDTASQLNLMELGSSALALQRVVDAVASVAELDNLLPEVLRIATRTFSAQHGLLFGFQENRFQLNYWLRDGELVSWEHIASFAVGGHATAEMLRIGFPIPADYFGDPKDRKAITVDLQHYSSECFPDFHATFLSLGVELELIVPLQAHGVFKGALLLSRSKSTLGQFTADELALAELFARQIALAIETHRLVEAARQSLFHTAVLEERTRLARDMHDTLAQGFLGCVLHLEIAKRFVYADPARSFKAIELAHELSQTGINEARRSVGMLRGVPQDQDLVVAITRKTMKFSELLGRPIEFHSIESDCTVSENVAEQLLGIIAEAIHNAHRHASADCIRVELRKPSELCELIVKDDGCGFRVAETDRKKHFGLTGMSERASNIGGKFEIKSVLGQGTTVKVSWQPTAAGSAE